MSTTFTASNGVELDELGYRRGVSAGVGRVHAARIEFYRHLEDERLGRWRWPENPEYVVYPITDPDDSDRVRVVCEADGRGWIVYRHSAYDRASEFGPAACAYFDAHPEPKPWHDAKEGEVWIVTPSKALTLGEKVEYPAIFQAGMFRDHGGSWGAADITDARCIWRPEGDAS